MDIPVMTMEERRDEYKKFFKDFEETFTAMGFVEKELQHQMIELLLRIGKASKESDTENEEIIERLVRVDIPKSFQTIGVIGNDLSDLYKTVIHRNVEQAEARLAKEKV